jgi:cellobiose phosphorylase
MAAMVNPYGYFDGEQSEYLVTRADTPLPWLNYLGQDGLFGLCTMTARCGTRGGSR